VGATVVAIAASGCGGGGGTPAAAPKPRVSGYITVATADPIAPVVRREARAFETANPLATVMIESAPSGTLSADLRHGRVADLYVAAGTSDMDAVVDAALTYGEPVPFATGADSSVTPVVFSVVLMNSTGDQTTSRAFMDFLTTPKGRSILSTGGFRPAS
jgi:ABC-type molybdate transport system substrate-binding protein